MAITILKAGGLPIPNPGNGSYRILYTAGMSSVTVQQPDPSVALVGALTFVSGSHVQTLDLAADRFIGFAAELPLIDLNITGVDLAADFSLVVV